MKTILLIDDEQDMLDMLKFSLELHKYSVMTATDGVEGLVKVQDHKPSLIILDVVMSNLDGCAFVRELRKDPNLSAIPILVLTSMKHLRKFFKEYGIHDYFEKPFQTEAVINRVKKLTGGA